MAVTGFHDGNNFLVLGCTDGLIRVLDSEKEPPPIFTLHRQGVIETLSCMKVFGDQVIFR